MIANRCNLVCCSPDANREQDHRRRERRHLQDDHGESDLTALVGASPVRVDSPDWIAPSPDEGT